MSHHPALQASPRMDRLLQSRNRTDLRQTTHGQFHLLPKFKRRFRSLRLRKFAQVELQGSEAECRQVSLHQRLSRLSGHGPEQWAHPALLGSHRKGRLPGLRLRRGNHGGSLFPSDEGEPPSFHGSHSKHLVQVPGTATGSFGRQQAQDGACCRRRPASHS